MIKKVVKLGVFLAVMLLFAQTGECSIGINPLANPNMGSPIQFPIHYNNVHHNQLQNNHRPANVVYKTTIIKYDNPFYINNRNINRIGKHNVYYKNHRPYRIGDRHIIYGANNRITFIGSDPVYYKNGRIYKIGKMPVVYNRSNEIIRIGNFSVWYGI